MFFSKTIEGLESQCHKYHNDKTTCENNRCYHQVKTERDGRKVQRCLTPQCSHYGSYNSYTTDLLNRCSQQKLGPGGKNCKPSIRASTGGFLCQVS